MAMATRFSGEGEVLPTEVQEQLRGQHGCEESDQDSQLNEKVQEVFGVAKDQLADAFGGVSTLEAARNLQAAFQAIFKLDGQA